MLEQMAQNLDEAKNRLAGKFMINFRKNMYQFLKADSEGDVLKAKEYSGKCDADCAVENCVTLEKTSIVYEPDCMKNKCGCIYQ